MNKVSLVGRLTRDPETKYTSGENATAVCRFNVAVDRRFKRDGDQNADFINVVAFGKSGEFVDKYFKKGQRIGLTGRIQTGSYVNKDGNKVYTTDVVAEEVEFVESKNASGGSASDPKDDAFVNVPEGDDSELPFN